MRWSKNDPTTWEDSTFDTYVAGFFDGEGSIGIYTNGSRTFFLRTQLTQNVLPSSESLAKELVRRYGGHYAIHSSLSRKPFFNWQLHSTSAYRFLVRIGAHLVIKQNQAVLAMAWFQQRPKQTRDPLGRYVPYGCSDLDALTAALLKRLKVQDMDVIFESQLETMRLVERLERAVTVPDASLC